VSFRAGDRVVPRAPFLIGGRDPFASCRDVGTIELRDAMGLYHVKWDGGRQGRTGWTLDTLALASAVDQLARLLEPEE